MQPLHRDAEVVTQSIIHDLVRELSYPMNAGNELIVHYRNLTQESDIFALGFNLDDELFTKERVIE